MPQIIHFSGHGSPAGEIILMDPNGRMKPVGAEALRMLFTTMKGNIRVVLLNACYSHIQAEAIAEVIDCVIGMSKAIGDDAAIIFAASFYRAIGFGRSVAEAFEQGRTAISLEGIPEVDTPQLITRQDVDPSKIFLIGTTPGPKISPSRIIRLNNQQKDDLVSTILTCSSMRDRSIRDLIVNRLPQEIGISIKRHPTDLVDITSIVDRCLDFSEGLSNLVHLMQSFEGDSISLHQVKDLLHQFELDLS